MDVARLNLAHGTIEEHQQDIRSIRAVSQKLNRSVSILLDLPGPKIRIGMLETEPLYLVQGSTVTFTTENILGSAAVIPVDYPDFPQSVSVGGVVYLNDGFIQLRILETCDREVRCKVVVGGELLSRKGMSIPRGKRLPHPVTEKDLELVKFGLGEGLDIFGMSFVEKAADIRSLKAFAENQGKSIRVIAKIERAEAVKNIDGILEVADGIMVARGDLGVQIPIEKVPATQKKLIRKASLAGQPVITATQMLESMTHNIRPTRAEATDVANAILDGTDAVMLSGETAMGNYPTETVRMMARIATAIEAQRDYLGTCSDVAEHLRRRGQRGNLGIEEVISLNATDAMQALKVKLILVPTHTGSTARRVSRFKPDPWIIAFCDTPQTHRLLNFSYGVVPVLIENKVANWHELMLEYARTSSLARSSDRVILTEGTSMGQFDGSDSIRIATL